MNPNDGFQGPFVTLLKACAKQKDIFNGRIIHGNIVRLGVLKDRFATSALIHMYAKCGFIADAQYLLANLEVRDVIMWNALISGCAYDGHAHDALTFFRQVQAEGLSPDAVTFISTLKACGLAKALEVGKQIHTIIIREGLLKNIVVGNALVDMYVKCGLLKKAQEMLDEVPVHDVVSWSTLIGGYAQQGHGEEVVSCYRMMLLEDILPNAVTFMSILKACGSIRNSDKGQMIHTKILQQGLLGKHAFVGDTLIDMYAKCGLHSKAQDVFDCLPCQDVSSWNVLISGYTQCGHAEKALECFEQMQFEGLSPNAATFACALKACSSLGAAHRGQEIHAEIAKERLPEKDIFVGTALADMYTKCGLLSKAQEVFDRLPFRSIVSWTTLIAGYTQHGHAIKALNCFQRMQLEGIPPNVVTCTCVLKACGSLRAVDIGEEVYYNFVQSGAVEKNNVISNVLIDMYAKCGFLFKAYEVFEKLQWRDVVSWTALLGGYVQQGNCEGAFELFERMQTECIPPNLVTYICILKACGNAGAAGKGEEVHADIIRKGILLEEDDALSNAVVDMYVKCGLLGKAQQVFGNLLFRDIVSWNILVTGYALLAKAEEMPSLLDKMIGEGIRPDAITFVSIFNACSHSGLLDNAQMLFDMMSTDYGIVATLDHYTCLIDLFGRAGCFKNVVSLVQWMQYPVSHIMWHVILAACQMWGNMELGTIAFECAKQLDEKDAATYICLWNMCEDPIRPIDLDMV